MNLDSMLLSLADLDPAPLVLCDLDHKIVYMNIAAINSYKKYGGEALLGECVLNCHSAESKRRIVQILEWFQADPVHNRVHTCYSAEENKDVYMVALRDESRKLIGYYEKHEYRGKDLAPFYEING